jgi:hypothetical protein
MNADFQANLFLGSNEVKGSNCVWNEEFPRHGCEFKFLNLN